MKKLLTFMMLSAAVIFAACSKDDGGSEGAGVEGSVKSIVSETEGFKSEFVFFYDSEGRVVKVTMSESEEGEEDYYDTIEYSYSGNEIAVGGTYFEGEDIVIVLNDDRSINCIKDGGDTLTYNYSYESGQLKSYNYYGSESVTWSGNNITNDGDMEVKYSDYNNNSNVDINAILGCLGDGGYLYDCYMCGPLKGYITGVWSEKLISEIKKYGDTYDYESSGGRITKIKYGDDDDDYVATVSYY